MKNRKDALQEKKLLTRSLSNFSKIVKQKKQAAREREKVLKAFAPLSRKLHKKFLAQK